MKKIYQIIYIQENFYGQQSCFFPDYSKANDFVIELQNYTNGHLLSLKSLFVDDDFNCFYKF